MDLLNEVPVTLVVKAPNQKVADQTVECALNWTVRKLKEHLARVYPSNPTENQQKIIYSGRLLQDDVTLKEVLRPQDENEMVHTVHLVCSNLSSLDVSTSQTISSTSSNSSLPTSEGLRHRQRASPSEATQAQNSIPHQQLQQQQQQQQPPPEQSSTTTTDNATERLQFHASAFHPSHYNPFVSAYLPQGAVGMTTPPAANSTAYSMEQMMWLQQQAYVQYMTNYMQLFQQGIVPPGQQVPPVTASPTPANQNVAPDQPAAAVGRQQPPAMRMNAQGGPVVNDDDDDEMDRDWLDWFYVGVRFALLMCILYFYSTPSRFLITLLMMILVCILQNGRFHAVFRRRQDAPAADAAPADPNGPNHDADRDEQPDDADTGGTAPEEPRRLHGLALAREVFISFFASLAPQPPPNVHAN